MPRIPSGEVKQRLLEARDNQDDGIPFERVRAQLGVLTPRLSRILPWWIEQDRKKALKIVKLVGGLGALASPPAHTSGEVASAEETQKGVQTQVRFVRSVNRRGRRKSQRRDRRQKLCDRKKRSCESSKNSGGGKNPYHSTLDLSGGGVQTWRENVLRACEGWLVLCEIVFRQAHRKLRRLGRSLLLHKRKMRLCGRIFRWALRKLRQDRPEAAQPEPL